MAAELNAMPAPLRWECEATRRYYGASVQTNLFGEIEVWRFWGGIGSKRGGEMHEPVPDIATAARTLAVISKRRTARGYQQR
jgi:predicted DNA-binding WGR domain protein